MSFIHPFFAQLESVPESSLRNAALIIAGALAAAYYAKEIFFSKKQDTQISPQPLTVEIVKAIHDQFAKKEDFEKHVHSNTERHGQLFNGINRVERQAREEMDRRFTALNDERRATLSKLDDQFTFIRENIASINTEMRINREGK